MGCPVSWTTDRRKPLKEIVTWVGVAASSIKSAWAQPRQDTLFLFFCLFLVAGWLPHPKPLREVKRGVGDSVHQSSARGIVSCQYPKGASPLGLVITDGSKALKQCLLTEAV